jgi:hypothetical protein
MANEFRGLVRRTASEGEGGDQACPPCPSDFPWPALWAFLTQARWDGGEPRVTGTLLVFSEGSRLKACLNDRDVGASGFVTLTGAGDPFDELEDVLKADTVDWRWSSRNQKRK